MNYRIAINQMALDGKLPQGDRRWAQFNDLFINRELEQIDIASAIYTGHGYAAWFNGRRKDDNFICAQHIAVDMETHDKRSSIEYIASMEFTQVYGGLIYSTPSHTDADPRSRIVFFLDQPIFDITAYEAAIGFVYSLFPGSDVSCIDSSRFFYGSLNCQLEWLNNTLPLNHLRRYYKSWGQLQSSTRKEIQPAQQVLQRKQADKSATAEDKFTPETYVEYAIKDAPGEGRNKRGYRLARQLKELGLYQFEAERHMRQYQQAVATMKQNDKYTEAEALASTKSAYNRAGMVH
jgi:hypothetical protein